MNDLISRRAVIELVEGWWLGHTKEDDLATEIKKLPSADKWIPVTERLPENSKNVLVTYTSFDMQEGNIRRGILIGYYAQGEWFFENSSEEVVAWMPLPKPYEEGDNDDSRSM